MLLLLLLLLLLLTPVRPFVRARMRGVGTVIATQTACPGDPGGVLLLDPPGSQGEAVWHPQACQRMDGGKSCWGVVPEVVIVVVIGKAEGGPWWGSLGGDVGVVVLRVSLGGGGGREGTRLLQGGLGMRKIVVIGHKWGGGEWHGNFICQGKKTKNEGEEGISSVLGRQGQWWVRGGMCGRHRREGIR